MYEYFTSLLTCSQNFPKFSYKSENFHFLPIFHQPPTIVVLVKNLICLCRSHNAMGWPILAVQCVKSPTLSKGILKTGQLLEYRQLLRHPMFKDAWNISGANECGSGRLAQGIKGWVKATDTIKFIRRSEVPHDRLKDITYIKFVCKILIQREQRLELSWIYPLPILTVSGIG